MPQRLVNLIWNFTHTNYETNEQELAYYSKEIYDNVSFLAFKVRHWKYKVSIGWLYRVEADATER